MRGVLTDQLKRFDSIYIIVDGLDELALDERIKLLNELRGLRPSKISLLLMSRRVSDKTGGGVYECSRCLRDFKLAFHCKVCDAGEFDICYDCKVKGLWCDDRTHELAEPYPQVEVTVKFPDEDIENFVRSEIGVQFENSRLVLTEKRDLAVNPLTTPLEDLFHKYRELPEQIIQEVSKKTAGRFLYARLYLVALKTKPNIVALGKALSTFPEKTDDIYKEAMQRITSQGPEYCRRGSRILGILTHARRSLGLAELKYSLAVLTIEEEGYSGDNLEGAKDETKTILESRSSLVVVEADQANLVHSSLE